MKDAHPKYDALRAAREANFAKHSAPTKALKKTAAKAKETKKEKSR